MQNARPLKEMNVKTVERSLMLLEILARENNAQPLTRIAQSAQLSVSTTYRMLNTLCRNNFIEKDAHTGHYRLGLKAFIIGSAAHHRVEIRAVALPFLTRLMTDSNQPSYLASLSGHNIVYRDCVKTANFLQITIQTGFPVPINLTASGMVLLAHLPGRERRETMELLLEKRLLDDPSTLSQQLTAIRAAGYAVRLIDYAGICESGPEIMEISAPIFNHLGVCSAAVSIIAPSPAASQTELEKKLRDKVRQAGTDISQALGFGKCG